jgi:ABC-2 type transport system permease protein
MKDSVIGQLILKDWHLQRTQIFFTTAGGLVALALLLIGGEVATVIGTVWFFVAQVFCACMLPMTCVINERKKQNLAFMMSLPVSSAQYSVAKLVSTVGMFLGPWIILLTAALYLIMGRHVLPGGVVPSAVILATLTLLGFCLILGAALVGESEGWTMAATLLCNSSYGLSWYFLAKVPTMTETWKSPVAIWNSASVSIVAAEFGAIAGILGLTLYLQSRKKDFI